MKETGNEGGISRSKLPKRIAVVAVALIVVLIGIVVILTGTTSNEKQVKARYDGQTYAKAKASSVEKDYYEFDGVMNTFAGMKAESAMVSNAPAMDSIENGMQMDESFTVSEDLQTPVHGKKIAYTYDYTVESTDFEGFVKELESTLERLGGYLEDSRVDQREHDRLDGAGMLSLRRGNFTIRVPADKVSEVVKLFSTDTAKTTYENVKMQDKTAAYVDAETQLESYKREYQRLEELLGQAESVSDTIAIQDRLSSLNYQIEWAKKQMALIDEDVDYSTVDLELYEVIYYTASIEAYKYEFGEELERAFREFIYTVPEFLFTMIYVFIGIVVIAGTVSVIVSVAVRRFEKKWGQRVLKIVDGRETEEKTTN